MKKLFSILAITAAIFAVSCSSEYDDTAVWDELGKHNERISKLETLCSQMNTNISSLQAIVTALQNNDYVTGVAPITQNGVEIGYTITFSKSGSITIYHGKDGKDGADGKDGVTPVIGVKQDTDGVYYWTLNGEWLLDDAGNKIKAQGTDGKDGQDGVDGTNGTDGKDGVNGANGKDGATGPQGPQGEQGITPMLKIENDYWYISYDNGASWTQLGKATGEDGANGADGTNGVDGKDGDSFFQSVTQDDNNVYFTLADGTVITVPKGLALSIEFAESDLVVMSPNSSREVGYTVTSATETVKVEVTSSADIKAKVVADNESGLTGKIHISTGDAIDEYSKVIVFVSNGDKVIMRSITFEEAGLQVADNSTKTAPAEGGEVVLEYLTNVDCEVVIPDDAQSWISVVPATRAMEKQTITLKLEPNEGAARSAEVIVESVDGKLSLTYTISQEPNLDYQLALEREALIAIYKALDGDNWLYKDNWCSDRPVGEWEGITTGQGGFVQRIMLNDVKNIKGNFPIEICKLEYLEELYLNMSHISGPIPDEISNLKNLRRLYLPDGSERKEPKYSMPKSIYSLKNLYEITIHSNWVTFEITDEISELTELEVLYVKLHPNSVVSPSIKKCTKLRELSLLGDDTQSIPKEVFQCEELTSLYLYNLKGCISESIGELQKLKFCGFRGSNITGEIPDAIGNLHSLVQLSITNTEVSGSIPKGLFTAFSTEPTEFPQLNLNNNNLSGSIPVEFVQFMEKCDHFDINLGYNKLSGDIPTEIQQHPKWCRVWPHIVLTNNFDFKDMYLPGPKLCGEDVYGNLFDSETDYAKFDYTILWEIRPDYAVMPDYSFNWFYMKELYEKYKAHNIQVLYLGSEWNTENELIEFKENYDVPFRVFSTNRNMGKRLIINNGDCTSYLPTVLADGIRGNQVNIIDKQGNVVFMSEFDGFEYGLELFLAKALNNAGSELYESTDYTQDGKVATLQTATKGDGIDIVLMGDAYSDRQIADGTYEADMKNLYNNLFTEEPYRSFKDHFNVYYVNVVSKNEGYGTYNETALSGYFGDGTLVGGDDSAAMNYALNAIEESRLDNANIVVMMNSENYAGTCYMYYPSGVNDYGSGVSVSYFPVGTEPAQLEQLLHHEACGHGFAKLADEYAYESMGAVPADYVSQTQTQQRDWGWWKNVDFTSDPAAVLWAKFIADERYKYDGLGAFEGGLTYWSGVWRPTEDSIMRYNVGGFNAPSREAIYYRIHKLAYGDSWTYDYEKFVEWDSINRKSSATQAASRPMVFKQYEPTAPPVVVGKSWREALGR